MNFLYTEDGDQAEIKLCPFTNNKYIKIHYSNGWSDGSGHVMLSLEDLKAMLACLENK